MNLNRREARLDTSPSADQSGMANATTAALERVRPFSLVKDVNNQDAKERLAVGPNGLLVHRCEAEFCDRAAPVGKTVFERSQLRVVWLCPEHYGRSLEP